MVDVLEHFAAVRPPRGQEQCACCEGDGVHSSRPCARCDGSGSVRKGSDAPFCPGHEADQPAPRRRHWRQASIRRASPEEYGKYVYPDYPKARTLPALARYLRKHEPDYYAALHAHIGEHGVQEPVLLRYRDLRGTALKRPVVMSGHHRAAAAFEHGQDIPVGDYDDQDDWHAGTSDFGQQWWRQHHELKEQYTDPRRHEAAGPEDYGIGHRPMEIGAPLHDLTGQAPDADYDQTSYLPDDYLTHPEWNSDTIPPSRDDHEALGQMRRVQGKPDAPVHIYRASHHSAPHEINPGDWVTLSKSYAAKHAYAESGTDDPETRYAVHHAVVPARHVRDAGSGGYREQGYWGPPIACCGHRKTALTHDELNAHLEDWFHPVQEEASRTIHPRSGYSVETGVERRVHHPERVPHGNESLGAEGPAQYEVWDNGDPHAPGHSSLRYPVHVGSEPIPHVYRGVGQEELHQARQRGYLQSDQRGTISPLEGTNAASDPRSAVSYLPHGATGHVLKIRVHPDEHWFTIHSDQYLRTRHRIPMDRVEAISPPITKDKKYGAIESIGARRLGGNPDDYGMSMRPDETADQLHDLGGHGTFPRDVYDTLHHYDPGGYNVENYGTGHLSAIRRARGNPDKMVTVYRAAPALNPESRNAKKGEINHGDWITLNRKYAEQEARGVNEPSEHSFRDGNHPERYHIWSARVPAKHVRSGGGDLMEWGYWGEDKKDLPHISERCSHRNPFTKRERAPRQSRSFWDTDFAGKGHFGTRSHSGTFEPYSHLKVHTGGVHEPSVPAAERTESVAHMLAHYKPYDFDTWDEVRDNIVWHHPTIKAFVADVARNGVKRPIPVDYEQDPPQVRNGHTRLLAAERAGVENVPTRQHQGWLDPDDPGNEDDEPEPKEGPGSLHYETERLRRNQHEAGQRGDLPDLEYYHVLQGRENGGYHAVAAAHEGQVIGHLTWGPGSKKIGQLWVHPQYRRHGVAEAIRQRALWVEPELRHHTDRTDAGDAWAQSVGGDVPEHLHDTTSADADRKGAWAASQFQQRLDTGHRTMKHLAVLPMPGYRNPHTGGGEWFHGSQAHPEELGEHGFADPSDMDEGRFEELDAEPTHHWNALLGNHFTADHDIARQFAGGEHSSGASDRGEEGYPGIVHARLGIANPKVYASEHDMDHEAYEHEFAAGNHPSNHVPGLGKHGDADEEDDDELYEAEEMWPHAHRIAKDYGHDKIPESTYGHYHSPFAGHPMRTAWLSTHPDRWGIADRFRKRLQEQGHDGIIYGNEYEKSKRGREANKSAIVFDPDKIHVTQHHHADEPCGPEPMEHEAARDISRIRLKHDPPVVSGHWEKDERGVPTSWVDTDPAQGHHMLTALAPNNRQVGWMHWDKGVVRRIDVGDNWQHSGLGRRMWERANEITPGLSHSDNRTEEGQGFAKAVGGPLPERVQDHPEWFREAANYRGKFPCKDCGWDTNSAKPGVRTENYVVHNDVWHQAGMDKMGGKLCVGCLEKRLGRQLHSGDFPDVPVNDLSEADSDHAYTWRTDRLKDRIQRTGATDWNEFHAKIPEEIHRGLYAPESHGVFSMPMSDEDVAHRLIAAHQEEQFPYERDRHKLFGTHWTSDEDVARGFAQEHKRAHFEDDDQCPDHDEHSEATPVVFHARRPARHEIEDDPRRLGWQNVDDYTDPEHEVPIKHGAPVHITGVSWLTHTGLGPMWHRHDLRKPAELRAEDRDSPGNPNEWNASLHTAAWQPTQRIFGPTYGLDHRLFDEHEQLRPAVRDAIMSRLGGVLGNVIGPDWHAVVTAWLAGSQASKWTGPDLEGNGDLDVLIGLSHSHARLVAPGLARLTDEEIEHRLNTVLRERFNQDGWHPPFDPGGGYDLTGYAIHAADIRAISPYAAYDLSDDRWAVQPPDLPAWSAGQFPQGPALMQQARALIAEVRAILRLPEPFRKQEAERIWHYIHEGRAQAFSEGGLGWQGTGNVLEKALDQASGALVGKLKQVMFGPPDHAPAALYHGMTTDDLARGVT